MRDQRPRLAPASTIVAGDVADAGEAERAGRTVERAIAAAAPRVGAQRVVHALEQRLGRTPGAQLAKRRGRGGRAASSPWPRPSASRTSAAAPSCTATRRRRDGLLPLHRERERRRRPRRRRGEPRRATTAVPRPGGRCRSNVADRRPMAPSPLPAPPAVEKPSRSAPRDVGHPGAAVARDRRRADVVIDRLAAQHELAAAGVADAGSWPARWRRSPTSPRAARRGRARPRATRRRRRTGATPAGGPRPAKRRRRGQRHVTDDARRALAGRRVDVELVDEPLGAAEAEPEPVAGRVAVGAAPARCPDPRPLVLEQQPRRPTRALAPGGRRHPPAAAVIDRVARELAGGGDELRLVDEAEARARRDQLPDDAGARARRPRRARAATVSRPSGASSVSRLARRVAAAPRSRAMPRSTFRAVRTPGSDSPSSTSVMATAGRMPTTTVSASSTRAMPAMSASIRPMKESTSSSAEMSISTPRAPVSTIRSVRSSCSVHAPCGRACRPGS